MDNNSALEFFGVEKYFTNYFTNINNVIKTPVYLLNWFEVA